MAATIFPVCVLLLLVGYASVQGAEKPAAPKNYFCYTTAGGAAEAGGAIKPGRCGEVCDAKTDSTQWIGWLGVVVATLCLGSNYVPVKKFDTGDGIFFQWVLCMGIWAVGLVVNMVLQQPPFFLSSLVAGIFWSLGNVLVVPIVKTVGLAMGLTLWSTTSLITGWITGVIILGQEIRCAPLNYTGVGMILVSVFILLFVRSEGKSEPDISNSRIQSGQTIVLEDSVDTLLRGKQIEDSDQSWIDRLGVWPKRALGVFLALFSGCIFGFQFVPIEYLKLCDDPEHSCEDLDYLFGYYTGILIGSTTILVIYSAYMNNKPRVYQRAVLPGLCAGILWGIGSAGLFLANKHLSLSVSIPFVTSGSQFMSAAWGILVFKEIKNWKYIILYLIALAVSFSGLIMDGISRCTVDCAFGLHTSNDSSQ